LKLVKTQATFNRKLFYFSLDLNVGRREANHFINQIYEGNQVLCCTSISKSKLLCINNVEGQQKVLNEIVAYTS